MGGLLNCANGKYNFNHVALLIRDSDMQRGEVMLLKCIDTAKTAEAIRLHKSAGVETPAGPMRSPTV
jgi:hypothetical protein